MQTNNGILDFQLDQSGQTWKLPDAAPYVQHRIERDKKFTLKFCGCLFGAAAAASLLFWAALVTEKPVHHYDRLGMLILMDQTSR